MKQEKRNKKIRNKKIRIINNILNIFYQKLKYLHKLNVYLLFTKGFYWIRKKENMKPTCLGSDKGTVILL